MSDGISDTWTRDKVKSYWKESSFPVPRGPLRDDDPVHDDGGEKVQNDPVNHPSHYTYAKYECIDILEELELPFHLANTVKYIWRAGKKDDKKTVEDLKKAQWYLNRYIAYLEKKG